MPDEQNQQLKEEAEKAEQKKQQTRRSLTFYLAILFAAALIFLIFAYLMQSRTSENTIDSLRDSVNSLQNVRDIYNSAMELQSEVESLEDQLEQQAEELQSLQKQVSALEEQLEQTQQDLSQEELTAQALNLLWQLEQAVNSGEEELSASLAEQLQQDDLLSALPDETPEGGGLSPYQRCLELLEQLSQEE
ncbi:MAG: hypothetical protein LUF80_01580 [Oscillospiraceae bacterium]|nr:hypothetical protein [Oscillospiraceae bacterium]